MKTLTNLLNTIIGIFLLIGIIWYFLYLSPTNQNYKTKVASQIQNKDFKTTNFKKAETVVVHKSEEKYYEIETIPPIYYQRSMPDDQFYNVLNTNKKVILILCPDKSYMTKFFIYNFQKKLEKSPNKDYYYYLVFQYDKNYDYKCSRGGQYCAPRYLLEACTDRLCIVNPYKRETLILKKLNPDLAMKLIDENITW